MLQHSDLREDQFQPSKQTHDLGVRVQGQRLAETSA
jgi:hypothetical protein